MNIKKEIMRELGAIDRCFNAIANIEFREYDLAKNQYIYLVRICEQPGIIMEKLCDKVKADTSTASRAIKKLCECDFVYKKKGEGNNKNLELYPTEKGLKIFAMLQAEEEYSDETALAGFSEEELKNLCDYLIRINQNITPDWETVKRGGKREYKK